MRNKMYRLMIGLPLFALAIAACGGSAESEAGKKLAANPDLTGDPIIIGVQQDNSGPSAPFATEAGKAIKDAVNELNHNDGIMDRPVKLVTANDESDPTKAPSVARKLIDKDADVVLVTSATSSSVQAKPVFEEEKVPAIGPIMSSSTFADPPENSFTYSVPTTNAQWMPVYCQAFKKEGYKSIAVFADDSAPIKAMMDIMLPKMKECIDVVENVRAPVDSQDLNPQSARIAKSKADAVFVASIGGKFEVLAHNTLATAASELPRFSMAGLGNEPESWKLANPGALDGLVFIGSVSSENPRTMELQNKMREWRGDDDYAVSAFDAQAYDAIRLVKKAIEKAESTDGDKINKALKALEPMPATFGQKELNLQFGPEPDDHIAANKPCGIVLTKFGKDNKPDGPWGDYQPDC